MSTLTSPTLPTRTATNASDFDDSIEEDSSEVTKLFHERLQALKHACGYFEAYIEATEKVHSGLAKDYDKTVLKTVTSPLREGHHFDQNLGGVAGLFDNIRSNTQGLSNSHAETAKALKSAVLPTFERLHSEIKSKTKELTKGAGKGAKAVDKARNTTQKHIETLGQQCAAFESSFGNIKAADDPYVIQRQVYHRLNKQVLEENNNRDDMIAVQNNFSTFESHVIESFQQGLQQFYQVVANQSEAVSRMYGDVLGNAQRIPPTFEWDGFVKRNSHILIDPNGPKRSVENVGFPHQDHKATRPLIAGSLDLKAKVLKKYDTGFYVITPAKYLHQFKTDDDFAKDPTPEMSLYLPDCLIGAVDGTKFNVKGKNAGGGLAKLSLGHEYQFKAHSPADALKWHQVIASVSGHATADLPLSDESSPNSPGTALTSPTTPAVAASPVTPATAVSPVAATAPPATVAAEKTAAEKEFAHMHAA